jgi:hypothetical protein
MALRNKYTIFNPNKPNSQGDFGSRAHDRLMKMFPRTLSWFGGEGKIESDLGKDLDLEKHSLAVFTPTFVKGDNDMWTYDNANLYVETKPGHVARNYNGAPDVYKDVLAGKQGLPGGPYIPNVASAIGTDPATLPEPPEVSNYNNIQQSNVDSYTNKSGVFSPKVSSDRSRQTLGSVLKKGKSKSSDNT